MFHLELRQFPHLTRAFNLSREDLEQRILGPWMAGGAVELNDRRWSPEKARLTIYESERLGPAEIGLGRGWGNVTRKGTDVTKPLLEDAQAKTPAAVDRLKLELRERAERGLSWQEVVALAENDSGVAQRAVWELLLAGELTLHATTSSIRRSRSGSDENR
jgi:hypothetical protein